MFQTIGKYWLQGVRPYSGLWDSKGPLIFFVNAVGYLITGNKTGVFLLQVINIVITALLAYRMLRIRFSEGKALLSTHLFLIAISLDYQIGNTVEEYCLPLLMLSFLLMYRWSRGWCTGESQEHPPLAAFVYGLCFAVCFLTRVTNAVGLCAAVFVVSCLLIKKRNIRNLMENAVAFLFGSALGILPFALYFAAYGELGEMWYGTIGYNLEYAGASDLKWNTLTSIVEGLLGLNCSVFMLLLGLLLTIIDGQRRQAGIIWLVSSGAMLLYLVNTNGYLHYALVQAPFFPIILLEIRELSEQGSVKRIVIQSVCVMICVVTIVSGMWCARCRTSEYYYAYVTLPRGNAVEPVAEAIELCKKIPEGERDSLSAYNCPPGLYLNMDICPKYRFFTMQDWAAKCSSTLKPKILETYRQGDAKWVLFATGSDPDVYEIIKSRYSLWDQVQIPYSKEYYQLFRLNE